MSRRTTRSHDSRRRGIQNEPTGQLEAVPGAGAVAIATFVVGLLSFGLALYCCWLLGYFTMFATFREWDDEGAMLFVMASLAKGRALYDQIVTMYGPIGFWPKLALVRLLSLPITHDSARELSLFFWWICAALLGAAVWRLGKSFIWFGIGAAVSFIALHGFPDEPGHPQDVCTFLLATAVLLSTFDVLRRQWIVIVLGVLAGLLTMTKINLGIFCVAAIWGTIAVHLKPGRLRTVMLRITFVGFAAGPFLLMRGMVLDGRTLAFAWAVSSSLVASLVVAIVRGIGGTAEPRILTRCAIAYVATILVVCLTALGMGTSVHGLWQGIIALPFRLSGEFNASLELTLWRGWMLATGLILALSLFVALRWPTVPAVRAGRALRLLGGMGIFFLALQGDSPSAHAVIALASPLMPILLLPSAGETPRPQWESWARVFLVFTALLETLWAYPVAGSQRWFGSMLLITASCVLVADGVEDFAQLLATPLSKSWARLAATCAVLAAVASWLTAHEEQAQVSYVKGFRSIGLPGCERIRRFSSVGLKYRQITAQLKANADVFFTAPGLPSFYFWTEMPPPAPWIVTNWMEILTREQQEDIIAALRAAKRPCIVYDVDLMKNWLQNRSPDSPLLRYINDEYRFACRPGEDMTEIRVRKDRKTYNLTDENGDVEKILNFSDLDRSATRAKPQSGPSDKSPPGSLPRPR